MLTLLSSLLFVAVSGTAFFFAYKGFYRVYRNIQLGRPEVMEGDSATRLKTMLLVAFGQQKMFKRPIAALLHLVIYVSFVITQIELIEIFIDGIFGTHRYIFHAWENHSVLHALYVFTINFIEFLSLITFFVTVAFLYRRDVLKLPRFTMREMQGWPNRDAHLILFGEIFLITNIFLMNSADMAASGGHYGFILSGMLSGLFKGMSETGLLVLEKIGWWGHLAGVLGFLVYLSYSKHLHIILAFFNTYYSRLEPKGLIKNMPAVTREVKLMLDPNAAVAPDSGEPVKFGAKDVMDLSWKNLLDAYTCTECGRCSAQCPAAQTGKLLSPRKIMMDTRDRLEEVGKKMDANNGIWQDDGKTLIENGYISVEELRACTTCNACVEECPVNISPLDIIVQLRRSLIMEDSNSPAEWNGMFANLENNGAPWQFSQQDRLNWKM
ncbi:MAG: (Fe-S)-binding protein [Chitinophagales bacterium]